MIVPKIKLILFSFFFFGFFLFGTKPTQAACPQVQVGCNGYGEYCPVGETPCHMEPQYQDCGTYTAWDSCGTQTVSVCANTCSGENWTCRDWTERRFGWECTGGWDYNSYTYGCDCYDAQYPILCNPHEVTNRCYTGEACVGGGCPVSKVSYCSSPVYGPDPGCVANPPPNPSPCTLICIDALGSSYPAPGCDPNGCRNDFPTQPAPGCQKVGSCYPISEPGKCAQNCISSNNVNTWDYCDCSPGVNPRPAQNCPGYCGYAGGTVPNGQGGQKICPTTPACPPGLFGSGNGIGGNGLSPLPTPVPIATSSFFQVQDAGVMAQQGGIVNRMPVGTTLSKGVAGVIIANGASDFGSGHASSTNWVAGSGLDNTGVISGKLNYRYDYDYVSGRIISTIRPNVGPNFVVMPSQLMVEPAQDYGIYWTKVTGDLDIVDNLDFGSNKVVVLVEGNANIKGKINFTKNQGLFALYVRGNINIDPSIGTVSGSGVDPTTLPAHLEGLYLAQGTINTGAVASQLRLEGAFVGIGGVNLQRNLNSAWPSEYFVFRPDILMNLPKQLLRQNHQWQELAP